MKPLFKGFLPIYNDNGKREPLGNIVHILEDELDCHKIHKFYVWFTVSTV